MPLGVNQGKGKLSSLLPRFVGSKSSSTEQTSTAERLTEASIEIAWILARAKKPFSDLEIVKDCFLTSAEMLFMDFDNKDAIVKQIKGLQLSDSTIMRWTEDTGEDVGEQLVVDLSVAPCFSIVVDKSTDVTDVAQLCVWVRFPKDNSIEEKRLLPLLGRMRSEGI